MSHWKMALDLGVWRVEKPLLDFGCWELNKAFTRRIASVYLKQISGKHNTEKGRGKMKAEEERAGRRKCSGRESRGNPPWTLGTSDFSSQLNI